MYVCEQSVIIRLGSGRRKIPAVSFSNCFHPAEGDITLLYTTPGMSIKQYITHHLSSEVRFGKILLYPPEKEEPFCIWKQC